MHFEHLKITGGTPLKGQIQASGAKNAMTKLLLASIVSNKKSIFHNVPNIKDVEITVDLCQEVGSKILWDKQKKKIEIITKDLTSSTIPQRFSGANRIPILMIGALLTRTDKEIIVPTLGGDYLGKRPLNFHIEALRKLGAIVEYKQSANESIYLAKAPNGLNGAIINLPYPSVGATENSILAAIKAKGTTVIRNAATEPEVIDLILFLQKIGVNITVDVNRTIKIEYTEKFYETEHTVIFDRNEITSYALAAIATQGKVFIKNAQHLNLISFLNHLRKVGGGFHITEKGIEFFYYQKLRGNLLIETDVHPGFMTDWQPTFGVLLTQSSGSSIIHETVYERRFGYTKTLKAMGANVELFTHCLGSKKCRYNDQNNHHSLVIKGPTPLQNQDIFIPDLRAGFAYIMAALIAQGTTNIFNVHFLDRGYEDITNKLSSLGAKVERIKDKKKYNTLFSKLIDTTEKEFIHS